ncbi:MAG: ABC transporter permease [Bradymonadales bacterium]|nr:ABC transporter permease [Bradymonadales bacterium]
MWKVAWRNIWRNRTRTVISITAIALSYATLLVSLGFAEAVYGQMEESAVVVAGGNILIHGTGYWASQSGEFLIADPDQVIETAQQVPGVTHVVPRVIALGLASSPTGSTAIRLSGIDPAAERLLQDLSPYVNQGTFLAGGENDPLVLGRKIAEDLELELGDRVVITATDADGEVTRALFHLTGILHTGLDSLDQVAAYTTLEAGQRALGMGSSVTQLGIMLERDSQRRIVRDQIRERLGERTATLELLTWDEALPDLVGYIEIDRSFGIIYGVVALIIVGFGIANTFLMSVMERIREFGLLGAIGLTPRRATRLVLIEALCLGLASLAIGLVIGGAIHTYFHTVGLDLAALADFDWEVSGVALADTVIYSRLNPVSWLVSSLTVLLLILATALYPAWRAGRLEPARAMRTFQ